MAKTSLNKKIDNFFQKYGKEPITKEIVSSSKLDIHEVNEYGNILHALVNYKYPEKRVLELIEILMKMGINVNKRGKSTGLTFIHLSLYGYTDESNQDHSYSQEFIIELINLARKHGLDVNVKDHDSETIVDAAIASEIYTGKIIPIIKALGPSFEVSEDIEKKYNYYLKSSSGSWHQRLQNEESEIRQFIKRSQLNPETIKEELDNTSKVLKVYTQNTDYSQLKEVYKEINEFINQLRSLITKATDLKIDTTSYQDTINNLLDNIIIPIILREIANIEKKPNDKDINILREIISLFSLGNLLDKVNGIASSYQDYKDELMKKAKGVATINEGNVLKSSTKAIEIHEKIAQIIDEKINELQNLVSLSKKLSKEIIQTQSDVEDFVDVEYHDEEYAYDDMTSKQLEKVIEKQMSEKEQIHNSVLAYVAMQYKDLRNSLMPLIDAGIITDDDLFTSFKDSQSKSIQKGKKFKNDKKK